MASHGALDSLTVGARGVAFLSPFDTTRDVARWRPIPASPLGFGFLSWRGLRAFESELEWLWTPTAVMASPCALWRRRSAS